MLFVKRSIRWRVHRAVLLAGMPASFRLRSFCGIKMYIMVNQTLRILHVDNDKEDHYLIREMLREAEDQQVTVEWAPTYDAARQMLNNIRYQAVLVDYDMDGASGIDLISEFTRRGYSSPMILLTGGGSHEIDIEAMHAGAALYLTKSEINPLLLERMIRYAIQSKRTEAQLRFSEEKFSGIFYRSPTPTFLLSLPDARFVDVNQAFLDLSGFDRAEVLGKSNAELGLRVSQPVLDLLMENGYIYGLETINSTKTGEQRITVSNLELIEIEGQQFMIGTAMDITERKLAELSLQQSEVRFTKAFRSNPAGLTITRLADDRYVDVNDSFCELIGYQRDELIGRTSLEVGFFSSAAERQEVMTRLVKDGRISNHEMSLQVRTGETYHLLFSLESLQVDGEDCLLGTCINITKHKQVEEELSDAYARLSSLIDANMVGVVLAREDGKFSMANDYFLNALGFSRAEFEEGQVDWRDQTPEEYAEADERALAEMKEFGVCTPYEKEFIRKDGRRVWVALRDVLLPSGEIMALVENITARKHTEAQYRELADVLELERAKLAAAIDHLPVGVGIGDLEGKTLSLNAAGLKLHGFDSLQDMYSRLDQYVDEFDLLYLDGRRMPVEEWPVSRALQDEFVKDYELRLRNKLSGEERILAYSVAPVTNSEGKTIQIVYVIQDMTGRKQVEESLKASEMRFRQLADSMPQLVWIAGPDGNPEYYNHRYREYDGITIDAQDVWHWRPVLHPEDVQPTVAAWQHSVETGEIYQVEHRIRMADGTYRWHLSRGVPAYDEENRLMKWYGTGTDIHDLQQARAELAENAARLQRSNDELENFALVASHDLQEPLRKIYMFGERLQRGLQGQLSEESADSLQRMQNAVHRMQEMIDGLLKLSRVTRSERAFELVDLDRLAREVVSDLEGAIDMTGGEVIVEPLPQVMGDALQLRQLLQNLVSNGLKFHRTGASPRVRVWGERVQEEQERTAKIVVEDNGIGFDNSMSERIFQPFVRMHSHTEYKGSGIGLAICRKIVERHGGRITAESRPGEGSMFVVTIQSDGLQP
jgi:PAS domain S-box-containing protein